MKQEIVQYDMMQKRIQLIGGEENDETYIHLIERY